VDAPIVMPLGVSREEDEEPPLASDVARNITGCVLDVDAGRHVMG
jgi:enoyl-[acyl-carrier-protein] reductase (NADH)